MTGPPKFKPSWLLVFREPISRWLVIALVLLNISQWISIWLMVPGHGQWLPLHYNIYFGIDLTGPWQRILLLPAAGSFAIILHLFGAGWVDHPVWRRSWLLMALLIEIILTISILMTIFNVIEQA